MKNKATKYSVCSDGSAKAGEPSGWACTIESETEFLGAWSGVVIGNHKDAEKYAVKFALSKIAPEHPVIIHVDCPRKWIASVLDGGLHVAEIDGPGKYHQICHLEARSQRTGGKRLLIFRDTSQ